MTNKNVRYYRQEKIENWDQEKLASARIAIVGAGQLSQFTAASLVALGIGNVEIYGCNGEEGFLTTYEGNKPGTLEKRLHAINPGVSIKERKTEGNSPGEYLSGSYDVILDLTNSSESKERVLRYSLEHGVKTVSASTGKTGGEFYVVVPGNEESRATLTEYDSESQGAFPSEILGGMITEEVRKALMPIREGEEPVRSLAYNATAERRFSKESEFDAQPYEDLSQKRVLIVGAGALGNFAALGMTLEGIGEIDILDHDDVDSTNLNRQI